MSPATVPHARRPLPARRPSAPGHQAAGLLAVLLSAAGCSDYEVAATASADGLLASLVAEPPTLDFGGVALGDTEPRTLKLHNPGDTAVDVADAWVDQPAFWIEGALPAQVPAGGSVPLALGFSPDGPHHSGMLSIESAAGPLQVALGGEGLLPGLVLDPPAVELGRVFAGCPADFSLAIHNDGAAAATLGGLGLIGEGATLTLPVDAGTVLAPGEAVVLEGRIEAPIEAPDHTALTAELQVQGLDPAITLRAPVTGRVAGRPLVEDQFIQDGPWPAVDLVMVVDRSGSMAEERMRMAEGARTLFAALDDQELDWRVGVVTADSGCLNGQIQRGEPFDEAAFLAMLEGEWGRMTESGLTLAVRAAEESSAGGCNAGFFRSRARPAFFFLSDEAEQSDEDWSERVERLQAWDPAVTLSALVGPAPDGCATAGPGFGYLEAAAATGGAQLSICSSDWHPWLVDESERLAGSPTGSFALSAPVAPVGTVEVWIDGAPTTAFSIDPDANTLDFPAHAWPGPGAEIEVVYPIAVDCDG